MIPTVLRKSVDDPTDWITALYNICFAHLTFFNSMSRVYILYSVLRSPSHEPEESRYLACLTATYTLPYMHKQRLQHT